MKEVVGSGEIYLDSDQKGWVLVDSFVFDMLCDDSILFFFLVVKLVELGGFFCSYLRVWFFCFLSYCNSWLSFWIRIQWIIVIEY